MCYYAKDNAINRCYHLQEAALIHMLLCVAAFAVFYASSCGYTVTIF